MRLSIAVRSSTLRVALVAAAFATSACPATESKDAGKPQSGDAKQAARKFDSPIAADPAAPPAPTKPTDEAAAAKPSDGALGKVLAGPLPIEALLGKTPADVQAQLSEPLGKGMMRKSCVRFLPERTWFSCNFAAQRYGDKSGAYTAIGIEYQDGISTAVAFEGPKNATGAFDPRAALAYVGLELPGEPRVEQQEGDAAIHSWFNASSRLLIAGKQYRVVVSSVANDWARTKVEVILNHPLTDEERARVVPAGGDAAGDAAPG